MSHIISIGIHICSFTYEADRTTLLKVISLYDNTTTNDNSIDSSFAPVRYIVVVSASDTGVRIDGILMDTQFVNLLKIIDYPQGAIKAMEVCHYSE